MQGREKDQINRGGEKIAAEEIENLLLPSGGDLRRTGGMEDELMGEKAVCLSGGKRAAALGAGALLPA